MCSLICLINADVNPILAFKTKLVVTWRYGKVCRFVSMVRVVPRCVVAMHVSVVVEVKLLPTVLGMVRYSSFNLRAIWRDWDSKV